MRVQVGAGENKLMLFETFRLVFSHTGSIEELMLIKISLDKHSYCLWTSIYDLPSLKTVVQTFFLNTLPTYSLDICPNFRRFFSDLSQCMYVCLLTLTSAQNHPIKTISCMSP